MLGAYTEDMRRIMVKKNPRKYTIVDDEDFEKLSQFRWNLTGGGRGHGNYVARRNDRTPVYMHREILNAPKGMEVDHINGNRTDNRKSNLRLCTSTQNNWNMRLRKDNTTGYKGLRWRADVKSWRVNVKKDGKEIQVGYFKDKKEAIRARDTAAKELYGEFYNAGK